MNTDLEEIDHILKSPSGRIIKQEPEPTTLDK